MIHSGQRHLLVAVLACILTACRGTADVAPASTAPALPATAITRPTTVVTARSAPPTAAPAALAAPTTTSDEWTSLTQRPLHLPLAEGASCPVTSWQPAGTLDPADFTPTLPYYAFGPGPVYPIIYQFNSTSRNVNPSHDTVSGWTFDKVLWLIAPRYRAPALVRAQHLGPPAALTFFRGRAGSPEETATLRLPTEGPSVGWQTAGSAVRFSSPVPGCYVFQVDGLAFSAVIVFRVTGASVRTAPHWRAG